jgi:hypothetical protein
VLENDNGASQPPRIGWLVPLLVGVIVASVTAHALVFVRLSALDAGLERLAVRTDLALARKRVSSGDAVGARPQPAVGTCNAPSSDEIRAIVSEELANFQSAGEHDAEEGTDTALTDRDPVENDAAFAQASRLVDGAIATRVWGDDQAQELRQLRRKLTPEQLDELTSKLIPAMNRQEVRVDAMRPF